MGPAVHVIPFMCPVLGGACNSICSLARGFKTKYERCEPFTTVGSLRARIMVLPRDACERSEKNRRMTLPGRTWFYHYNSIDLDIIIEIRIIINDNSYRTPSYREEIEI